MRKLVRSLVQGGDLEGAIQALLAHAQANPEQGADALTLAGEIALELNVAPQPPAPGAAMLVFQGDRRRAEMLFRAALRATPAHGLALYGLAKVLPETSPERIETLTAATTSKPTYLGLLELGDALRSFRNDYEAAYAAYRQAHELDPRDRGTYTKLADVCKKLGRPDEALQWRAQWQQRRQAGKPAVKARVLEVTLDPEGWTRCPACNRRFSVTNSGVFKDGQHRCGQALSIRR